LLYLIYSRLQKWPGVWSGTGKLEHKIHNGLLNTRTTAFFRT